jgi:hypothetical protein
MERGSGRKSYCGNLSGLIPGLNFHQQVDDDLLGHIHVMLGPRGVGQILQGGFDIELDASVNHCIYRWRFTFTKM